MSRVGRRRRKNGSGCEGQNSKDDAHLNSWDEQVRAVQVHHRKTNRGCCDGDDFSKAEGDQWLNHSPKNGLFEAGSR